MITKPEVLIKLARGVIVKSLASGNMAVIVDYPDGIPGGLGRMAIAAEIERLINAAIKRGRKR